MCFCGKALPFNKVGGTSEIKNKCDLFLYFSRFALPLQQLSACLLIVAYFHICSTFAARSRKRLVYRRCAFRGGEVIAER